MGDGVKAIQKDPPSVVVNSCNGRFAGNAWQGGPVSRECPVDFNIDNRVNELQKAML